MMDTESESPAGVNSGSGKARDSEAAGSGGTGRAPVRRRHKRVVRKGAELFDADSMDGLSGASVSGMRAADGDTVYSSGAGWREADEEERILNELPPHWGIFDAEKR
ncbi:hypothetical protein ACFQ1H_03105 [Scardovia wiggsiae]|uniref:Uncharacterized protein n=1 Tax=Scardovia wiggsiae F0424 TaxID=857290 RepID=J0X180_9BIFI|nr:hypothetical protein [Scardovia wiggsiae]EJD65141.1 hypothetical protein HMPREF9156_00585 [Scardovia wiggsiae F0424]